MHSHLFFASLTRRQRILLLFEGLLVLHFVTSTVLWLYFMCSHTTLLLRNSAPGQFWPAFAEWLPFYLRVWKSVLPLTLGLLALGALSRRPLVSISLLAAAIVFSVCCAFCDISSENWDLATFGPEDGHLNHYLNWWWCSQRPK